MQNGIAGRKNRALIEMARCQIAESKLPQSLWAEAVATSNDVRDRCSVRCLEDKTSYELLHGEKPDLRRLRFFGANAFVLIKTQGKEKFDERANEGRMVGYAENAKAYRVKSNSGKIVSARDVPFDESRISEMITEIETPSLKPKEQQTTSEPPETKTNSKKGSPFQKKKVQKYQKPDNENSWMETETNFPRFVEPAPKRGRGRPRIISSSSRGRSRKLYRMTSACTVSSQSSVEGEPEQGSGDVFKSENEGSSTAKKRPSYITHTSLIQTSLIQTEKRATNKQDAQSESSEEEINNEQAEEKHTNKE